MTHAPNTAPVDFAGFARTIVEFERKYSNVLMPARKAYSDWQKLPFFLRIFRRKPNVTFDAFVHSGQIDPIEVEKFICAKCAFTVFPEYSFYLKHAARKD